MPAAAGLEEEEAPLLPPTSALKRRGGGESGERSRQVMSLLSRVFFSAGMLGGELGVGGGMKAPSIQKCGGERSLKEAPPMKKKVSSTLGEIKSAGASKKKIKIIPAKKNVIN